ncbi:MAG TPA: hypothetical protein VK464_09050 [Symbiobacteriaceae bacterium]|jgi:hypothetical protein|nr:hypothetical protein [Symbiobacteriaceae bacterium]
MALRGRRFLWFGVALVLAMAGAKLLDLHVSVTGAIATPSLTSRRIRTVESVQSETGAFLLFEDTERDSFGVAAADRVLGFLWRPAGGAYGYSLEPTRPLQAAGFAIQGPQGDSPFLVGVKVAPTSIQYLALGCAEPCPDRPDGLNLEAVRKQPKTYTVVPVSQQYAFFVADAMTTSTWTIWAFDAEGQLVAWKPAHGEPQWLHAMTATAESAVGRVQTAEGPR